MNAWSLWAAHCALGPGKVLKFGGRVFDSEKSFPYNPWKGVNHMLMLADFRKKKMNNLNSQQILEPKLVNVVKILLTAKKIVTLSIKSF